MFYLINVAEIDSPSFFLLSLSQIVLQYITIVLKSEQMLLESRQS